MNRERKPGGGRIGNLGSYAAKLFFMLFYFKCYTTFDILGFLFDLDRSNANRNIHKFTSIPENALGTEMVSLGRKISTVEELLEVFPDVRDLLIDGTERPIQRPKDNEKQKENHSWLEENAYSKEYNHLRQEETDWLCKPNYEWKKA